MLVSVLHLVVDDESQPLPERKVLGPTPGGRHPAYAPTQGDLEVPVEPQPIEWPAPADIRYNAQSWFH